MKSIFVSSTFKDMQSERNIIQFRVMPEINRFLKDYEETIEFTDLRWGIDTTKYINSTPEKQIEGEQKVLKICLEEISKTPYFIVILGERYGWIPENKDMVEHVIKVLNKEQQIEYALQDNNMSVTHLEIDYGAFYRKHPENCLFYFRELKQEKPKKSIFNFKKQENIYFANNEQELNCINNLKQNILKEFPDRVRTYSADLDFETNEITGIDEFANMIINDVKELIKRDFTKIQTKYWQEKEEKEIKYIINRKTEKFTGQKEILHKIDDFIENDNQKDVLFITGEAGCGKSAISSRVYQIYKDKYNVVPFFVDNTENSNNARDILKYNLYQLYKKIDINMLNKYLEDSDTLLEFIYDDEKQAITDAIVVESEDYVTTEILRKNMEYNLEVYSKVSDKKLIFIIDAIDQLQQQNTDEKKFNWLPKISLTNVKYVVTCLKDSELSQNPLERMQQIEMTKLTKQDVIDILKYNNKYSTKELNDEIIEKISQKEGSTNFLYLSLVLQRLRMFSKYDYSEIKRLGNDMNAINAHMLNIVEYLPDELEYLCIQVMEYANKIYSTTNFKDILALIAHTRYGLREKDIEAIFKQEYIEYDSATFRTLLNFLDNYFIVRDDQRIDFSHRIIRQIVKDEYKNDKFAYTTLSYNEVITSFLITLDTEDMMYITDLVFHLWKGKHPGITILNCIYQLLMSDDEEKIKLLAKELWKYFRVDSQWIYDIQEYIVSLKNKEEIIVGRYKIDYNIDELGSYFNFLLNILKDAMNDNAYEKKLYLNLMKWWEFELSKEKLDAKLQEVSEEALTVIREHITTFSTNLYEVIEVLKKLDQDNPQDARYLFRIIKSIKKENIYFYKERLECIEELLSRNIIESDTDMCILMNYKAETYYFMGNMDLFNEIMSKQIEKYKTKMYSQNKTYEDCEMYLETLKNIYTVFDNEPLKSDDSKVEELIDIAKEILEWAKEQYKIKKDEKAKLEVALSYQLVIQQYNMLVYKQDNKKLQAYDAEKGSVYVRCFVELMKDNPKYNKHIIKLLDAQIELLEAEERLNEDKKIDKSLIKSSMKKAIETLNFEDINKYFDNLPIVEPIYEVEEYEDIDELLEIYEQAHEFIENCYDENLYSEKDKLNLYLRMKEVKEARFCLNIAKHGITEKNIEKVTSLYYFSLNADGLDKVYKYRAYQYLKTNTYKERVKIIEKHEQTCKDKEDFFRRSGGPREIDNLTMLYKAKRDAYIDMIEKDELEQFEDEKQNDILIMKEYIWSLIISDDIHVVNDIKQTYSTLVNVIKDRKASLELELKRYELNKDEKILEEIYKQQELFVTDICTICSKINEKSYYEYGIELIKGIINFQKDKNYLEKISEYEDRIQELKEKIQ